VPNTVIHIGFPKTATTTLQTILRNHTECDYLGKGLRESLQPSLSLDIARAVLFANTRHFEAGRDALAAQIAARADKAGCLVISDEAFAFAEHMAITRQWQRQAVSDHDTVATRLAQLCPDAQVLMSFRAQPAFIKSMYRQNIKRDSITESFSDYVDREIDALPHRSMLHTLRYDHAFTAYADRFSADNVHTELFEDTKTDFEAYLHKVAKITRLDPQALIAQWGGAHENTDRPQKVSNSHKRLQRLMPSGLRKLAPVPLKALLRNRMVKPPVKIAYTPQQSQVIDRYFAQPNATLAQETGLNLHDKGYPMP
jgi:hypothetical protein